VAQKSNNTTKAKKTAQNSKTKAASPAEKRASKGKKAEVSKAESKQRFFDDRTRRDIWAVVFGILAIVVLIMAVIPSDAIVTSFISNSLHIVFGLGSYILPAVFIIIAGSFLIAATREHVGARFAIGLTIIFLAILTLLAIFTPEAVEDPNVVFSFDNAKTHGGWVGAGIAWAGLTLFDQAVSVVVMIGLIIAGLIIIGLSLSKPIEAYLEKRKLRLEEQDADGALPQGRMVRNNERAKLQKIQPPQHDSLPGARKPRRALSSLNTKMMDDREEGFESDEPFEKAMTRKLGKKSDGLSQAKTNVLPKPTTGSPLAVPIPQEGFELPKPEMLSKSEGKTFGGAGADELKSTAGCLQETLEDFGIFAQVVGWVAGPTVTLFKVDLPSGIRVSRITALEDDIALALAAPGVRIFAPIPGTNYVGIEVPNKARKNVLLGDVLQHAAAGPLQIAIGMDVEGRPVISDLAKMPHLLIGGTTGSGKSVSINAMIMSLLMRATPAEVRLIMIDPKRVEFTPYNGIPHLYVPVVTEPREAASALSWGVAEMERRLKIFSAAGARNIGQYNAKVQNKQLEDETAAEMPYIVIIIDELADLMMNVGKEVEYSISRIAQLARAAGIHLIVATQRPSTNVVTGLIKANITNRIAFNVASGIDSRVVLDTPGAENLIGLGDLLLSKPEFAKPQRIQGCYVSEDEINNVVNMLKDQCEPEYHHDILKTNLITLGSQSTDSVGSSGGADDPLLWEAADIVVSTALGSTSNIQRRLKVGYSRAGRIMDMLEEKGVVGPPNGSKPREVLVDEIELETLKAFESQDSSDAQSFAEE